MPLNKTQIQTHTIWSPIYDFLYSFLQTMSAAAVEYTDYISADECPEYDI